MHYGPVGLPASPRSCRRLGRFGTTDTITSITLRNPYMHKRCEGSASARHKQPVVDCEVPTEEANKLISLVLHLGKCMCLHTDLAKNPANTSHLHEAVSVSSKQLPAYMHVGANESEARHPS